MRIRWGRAIAAVVTAEVLGVGALAALVAIFGPSGFEQATRFAERLGVWVGPISGFVLCLIGGWWTAKAARRADRVLNGVAVGVLAAVLDVMLAVALAGPAALAPLLFVSNLGRIVAATLGGWLAARRS